MFAYKISQSFCAVLAGMTKKPTRGPWCHPSVFHVMQWECVCLVTGCMQWVVMMANLV